MKKMKTALCLHGYFNSSRDLTSKGTDGFKHIKKHVLDHGNIDVYIHSWDLDNKEEILNLYGDYIKDYTFEQQIDFKDLYNKNGLNQLEMRDGATPFWNVFSQFYSVQKSFELLKKSNEDYDIVIKGRFDLGRINRNTSGPGMNNPYPVQCINFQPDLNMEKFYLADWQYNDTEGPPDMWFYSNMQNMTNFSKFFDIVSQDVKLGTEYQIWAGENDGGMLNTIKAWKWCLIKTGLWDKKCSLETHWE